jgi:hypothetical protein
MEAIDQHGLHTLDCAVDGSAMEVVGDAVFACTACGHRTDEPGAGVLGDAFDVQHRQWGLRGDPHVWAALRDETAAVPTPADAAAIRQAFVEALRRVADVDLDADVQGPVQREQFAHGGMSSGMVDVDWWRAKGLPLLVERATERRPAAQPKPGGGLMMGLVVWAVLVAIPAGLVGGGAFLLYQRYAGTSVQATVLACETSGNWSRFHSTVREDCAAEWTIDGQTVTGGFVAGNGASDVGKTVGATVRNGTAYSRSLVLPLILLALGIPFLVPVVIAVRSKVTRRTR